YRVRIEHRGDAGLAAARTLHPAACVLDIALPGMDGVEVCRRLRQAGDWTPVIFLTARDDELDRVLDPARRRVTVDGRPVALTGTEFALLEHLMSRPGRVLSRAQLLAAVWGWSGHPTTRTVDVHVAQVRAKLGD